MYEEKPLHRQTDGEWVQPTMRGFRLACCDCGLMHRINFRIVNGRVQFQAFRLKRRDAACERSR